MHFQVVMVQIQLHLAQVHLVLVLTKLLGLLCTTLTSGGAGAKGVVTNVPYITDLPHFTTVPYQSIKSS